MKGKQVGVEPVPPGLVSVVIPAFNAVATIDETLHSVRTQTYPHLEIIVVDDGSRDATREIVRRHATADPRIRLIEQANAGVAAARNRGIAAATGDYVAPVDADDLWRPQKIEKQMEALHRGGEAAALVYTWSARIDADSRVFDQSPGARHAGIVTREICCSNFIGNGSAVLMRKDAVLEAGGYDPSLRERMAEGVEDWLLYFRIATRHQFAVVPEHLTGYRYLPTSMSANFSKMLKGYDLVVAEMCQKYPQRTEEIKSGRLFYLTDYQFANAIKTKRPGYIAAAAISVLRESALRGARKVAIITVRTALRFMVSRLRFPRVRGDKGLAPRVPF
jgi:glycosyltransferase involved in cell wall biosynthesis